MSPGISAAPAAIATFAINQQKKRSFNQNELTE